MGLLDVRVVSRQQSASGRKLMRNTCAVLLLTLVVVCAWAQKSAQAQAADTTATGKLR